ncbi:MAG TPA: PAS domain-containing protein [Candidatus Cybelea sp.]|nr:PAS domain-containing protein [Candidatus Cybelea sp.]
MEIPAGSRVKGLYDYWLSKCGGRRMPPRAALDPLEMKPWLGHLLIVAALDDGNDFLYNLYGTTLVQLFGFEATGKRVSQAVAEGLITEVVLNEYRKVCKSGQPHYIQRMRSAAKQHMTIEKLILPLSNDGAAVDRLLTAIYACEV